MSKGRHGNPLARGQEEKFVPHKRVAGMIRNRARGTRWEETFRQGLAGAQRLRFDVSIEYPSIYQGGTLVKKTDIPGLCAFLSHLHLLLLLYPSVLPIDPSPHPRAFTDPYKV